MKEDLVFQAFEYASYNIRNEGREGKFLPPKLFESLKSFSGEKELPYYSLTANGVRFKNYVGALQVGKWTVEVLPKFDRLIDENRAQPILIQMLRQAGILKTNAPTESSLRIKKNYILDTYIQMFLEETRIILHQGLIKKYHKKEENTTALKGALKFSNHIKQNLIHAERFYVRHTIYDRQHELNRVLFKTLNAISIFKVGNQLRSEINDLRLCFPELSDIIVSEDFFQKLSWGRKTEPYKKAIEIARLLLLNYHPDLSHGKNHVLALMFDMNSLWETWVVKRLKLTALKSEPTIHINVQRKRPFWTPSIGRAVNQQPDIIIKLEDERIIILDTKWKLIHHRPSEDDLRQMYVYNMLFNSKTSFLVYPGNNESVSGTFFDTESNGSCGLSFIPFLKEGNLSSDGIEHFFKNNIVS